MKVSLKGGARSSSARGSNASLVLENRCYGDVIVVGSGSGLNILNVTTGSLEMRFRKMSGLMRRTCLIKGSAVCKAH